MEIESTESAKRVAAERMESSGEEQEPDAQLDAELQSDVGPQPIAEQGANESRVESAARFDKSKQLCEAVGTKLNAVLKRVRSSKSFGRSVSDAIRNGLADRIRFPDDYIPIERSLPYNRREVNARNFESAGGKIGKKLTTMNPKRLDVSESSLQDCGRGVKALQSIQKDTFVCEFVGELISAGEVDRRERKRRENNEDRCFMFDLIPEPMQIDDGATILKPITIDAFYFGNQTRFLQHSCMPNCYVDYFELNGTLGLGIFSGLPIKKGNELFLDYTCTRKGYNNNSKKTKTVRAGYSPIGLTCRCKKKQCYGRI